MAWSIRPARLSDAGSLARIQVDSYRTAYAGLLSASYLAQFSYEEQERDWWELLAHTEDILLVAEDGRGELAGYALGRQLAGGAFDSELVALHVRGNNQGLGAGRQLIAMLAAHLRAQGCQSLMVWTLAGNESARALYEHLGGNLVDRAERELAPGEVYQEVAYGWPELYVLT